jgi:hypothetical protein
VSEPVARLLLLNVAFAFFGLGLLPLLGIARTPRDLAERSGLAYLLGVAVIGIVGTDLPIAGVAFSLPLLSLLVVAVLAGGAARMRRARRPEIPGSSPPLRSATRPPERYAGLCAAIAVLGALALLLVHAGRAFVVHPLGWTSTPPPVSDYDSWAIWALKARALVQLGDTHNAVFTSHAYALSHLDYPLAYVSIQALDYRAMGGFFPTPMHLQLMMLAVGFVAALVSLLRGRTPIVLLAAALLLLFAASMPLAQLETAYADMPLAFMIAAGVAGLSRYLLSGERFALHAAVALLGAGALTKNEGLLFALCAFAAAGIAALARNPARLRALGVGALVVVAIILPWRIWVAAHPAPTDYRFSNMLDLGYLSAHTDRVRISFEALRDQLDADSWGWLSSLLVIGALCAALARRFAFLSFAVAFLLLALAGLVTTYWVAVTDLGFLLATSSYRVVDTLVVSGVVLAAIGAGEAWRLVPLGAESPGGRVEPALTE